MYKTYLTATARACIIAAVLMLAVGNKVTGHLAFVSGNARCMQKGLPPPSPNIIDQNPPEQPRKTIVINFAQFAHAMIQILYNRSL